MGEERDLQRLTLRIASGDIGAFEELFLSYHQKLLHFSLSITHSKESSEEIVSDVFLKLWLKRAAILEIENIHLYLYVSTKNLSINYVLKQKKEQVFSFDQVKVEMTSVYFDPERLMITAEMLRRVQQAIQQLPPKCQLVFKLVKEDGLKYKDVADLLGLSIKTIENQMSIALKKIATAIQFVPAKSPTSR